MNRYEADVLLSIVNAGTTNQRLLSAETGHSLGVVNRSLKMLKDDGLVDENTRITEKGLQVMEEGRTRQAIILAAGFGMRMVPINLEVPKGLIKVHGECLIERTIEQLHEVGITKIYVVVGFLMEQYEYLIDKYGVELVVNPEYAEKNNLYSLSYALKFIDNAYIIPCDVWCKDNPYNKTELYSWYMVSDKMSEQSSMRVTRDLQLAKADDYFGAKMIGISYITTDMASQLKTAVGKMCGYPIYDNAFWEDALFSLKARINARIVRDDEAVEINTYEQLREFDSNSNQLRSDAINVISEALGSSTDEVTNIEILKKGMTNRSFIFSCKGGRYIMRIPGEGTDLLIDRDHEAAVYKAISGKGFCDDPVYLDPSRGYKITKFLENVRSLNPESEEDLRKGMKLLRSFHDAHLTVDHEFDIFGQMMYYETLWNGHKSCFADYEATRDNVLSLRSFIERVAADRCLTHIDAVPDNFLFYEDENGNERLQLTDWEYSGMQDPHVDIAMFSIYSLYSREQIDHLIDIYFDGKCEDITRIKIYCYVAICGMLWSNWCEFKRHLGVEFGEYSLRQYRYAKDFYRLAMSEAERCGICITQ
ncbi:CTP:phosphocholine cytidylyltransferase [Ruminococcaceae bacterium YRB3002]|nr:CTP:phosphocholine cytidylyltransferase [Ruminococcaceae bacterium YRB3002]